ncbi:efflux RND transporter periplasmic adaptor subunit [Maribellus comscasis]|uniref:Efflux RND transporter periplasmic adaptor subunit n=1 Tax=Maribellus comscasis TaxID=2681766 RepID=A0A6I6JTW2_9BACT|nr:efflux RND transporter periplasmic adaptor subunit [Maribellus comscasis]QGY46535.1 efflux RND transporter periplasmic adaptor subunit [Maribellus comscasis]
MKFRNNYLVLGLAIILLSGCKNSPKEVPQAETIKKVKVETITDDVVQNTMILNGKIKEKSLTSLSFRVGGPLMKLTVKQGDYVRAGQVIAEIDDRDYQLQAETSKAQFEQAEGEYNRYKKLVEQKKIPENTFEKIKSGYLMTKTAYENAQNQLNDTKLKAPFSGFIYEKFVENYQTVGAGTPIVSVMDNSHLEVVVPVAESQLNRIKADKQSFLNVENAGIKQLPIQLLSVSEKTMQDGLYEVKFSFTNKDDLKVAPGMTAEVNIYCKSEENRLSVASTAIFHEKTATYVWVYNPSTSTVKKREVKISLDGANGRVNIASGVNNGEQIVTAGVHYLVEGQKVEPLSTPSVTNIGGLL